MFKLQKPRPLYELKYYNLHGDYVKSQYVPSIEQANDIKWGKAAHGRRGWIKIEKVGGVT